MCVYVVCVCVCVVCVRVYVCVCARVYTKRETSEKRKERDEEREQDKKLLTLAPPRVWTSLVCLPLSTDSKRPVFKNKAQVPESPNLDFTLVISH